VSAEPSFELVETERLKVHEKVVPGQVRRLTRELRSTGVVSDPILVDRESLVILNGHHRYAALRALGAKRIPTWMVDYDDPSVRLGRWSPGPSISKREVRERATSGKPFPPKTTRHHLPSDLPPHPTQLADLMVPADPSFDTAHAGGDGPGTSGRGAPRRSPRSG